MKARGFEISIGKEKFSCIVATDTSVAKQCMKKLISSSAPCLGADIETAKKKGFELDPQAGLCPYRSKPSLLQIYDPHNNICVLFDLMYLPVKMFQPIFTAKRCVFHNALFDKSHLMHAGLTDLKFDDSMIMYNIVRCAEFASLEEEQTQLDYEWESLEGEGQALDFLGKAERHGASLRTVIAKLLGIKVEKEMQQSDWTSRPLTKEQLIYSAIDAWATYKCGKILAEKIKKFKLTKNYGLNRDALEAVCQMMLNGSKINEVLHKKHCAEWDTERDAKHVQVLKIFGGDANIRSTTQISRWLEKNLSLKEQQIWPRSEKTGRLKSDARTLDQFKYLPFVAPLLQYKKLEKMSNTYGYTLLEKICPVTKRLSGSYTLGYTATGRLSSRSPNLQNLPRDSNIREIFIAEKGNRLVDADFSQIEIRVAGELSRDPVMLQVYLKGEDLYNITASRILNKSLEKVTKQDRQLSKAIMLGLIFGLGAKGLVEYARWNFSTDITLPQAYVYYKDFFKLFAGYSKWQKERRDIALSTGYTTTRLGKLRKLQPDMSYTRSCNHPVQGSAAEVVIQSLINVHKGLKHIKAAKIINIVHDEILVECPIKDVPEVSAIIKEGMESAMKTIFPKATMNNLVNLQVGKTWAEAH